MFRHVLPNAIGPVTALVPTSIAGVIGAEAVLAFLGIGVRPPAISWGIMISNGSEWVLGGYPHMLLFPLGLPARDRAGPGGARRRAARRPRPEAAA